MRHYDDRTDGELVEATLDGDDDAYGELVDRYEDVLYSHAVRMTGGEDGAKEVLQRAFIRGYRRLSLCRQPEKVGGWLFRITSNLCKDHLKARHRDGISLEDGPTLATDGEGPDTAADRAELRDALRSALDALTPEKKEAFLLKHLQGKTYGEMSELLDVGVSALKMRVHRAREELQEHLSEYATDPLPLSTSQAARGAPLRHTA